MLRSEPDKATRNRELSSSSSAAAAETSRHASARFNHIHSHRMTLAQLGLDRQHGLCRARGRGYDSSSVKFRQPSERSGLSFIRLALVVHHVFLRVGNVPEAQKAATRLNGESDGEHTRSTCYHQTHREPRRDPRHNPKPRSLVSYEVHGY